MICPPHRANTRLTPRALRNLAISAAALSGEICGVVIEAGLNVKDESRFETSIQISIDKVN
jgi:hypothetical protein